MERPAIGPLLATGVVLVGAATIVANPVVPPPADIRVSAAEYAASGNGLDVLDPVLGVDRREPTGLAESP